jgi:hypothetical protein
MEKLNLHKTILRKFGLAMAIAFLVVSGLFFFRQKHAGATHSLMVSCVFIIAGLALPVLLRPVYVIWMRFAFILGWVNARAILVIIFYLIFTPLGLVLRLFKVDLLQRQKKIGTYWKMKEEADFNLLNYERRF